MLKKQRYLALLLTILLIFSMPIYASADEAAKNVNSSPVRVQEVTDLRATNSETYLLSDGTYECVVYAEDKYYYDGSKSLQLIDNSIVPNGNILASSSKAYKNAANKYDVYFSRAGVPQIEISAEGYGLTFSPLSSTKDERNTASTSSIASIGAVNNCETLDTLTFTGKNTVTYADVFSDTNLVYVLENGALKEYIILESKDAPNEFSFSFALDGLSYQVIGEEHCFVNELGETVFSLAPLFAIDANGELTENVFYEVTAGMQKNTISIKVQLDEDYLSDSSREFPVVVDPSIMITGEYKTYDTYVSSRYPTSSSYYLQDYLRTGKDEDFYVRRTYIQFELPYYINSNNVTSAYVGLKVYSGSTPNLTAYRVKQFWERTSITWNNAPSHSTTDCSTTCTVSSDNWCNTYVTSIVKQWLSGNANNYGLMIRDANESSTSHWTTFYSSDSGYPNRPELRIYYTFYDTVLTAYREMANGQETHPRDDYFNGVSSEVLEHRSNNLYTHYFLSTTKENMISIMQSTYLFFVHTHGEQNAITIGPGITLTSTDLANVNLNNLKFALLLTCETGKDGYSATRVNNGAPINIVERMIVSGAETVIGFSKNTNVYDCNEFAPEFAKLTMDTGYSIYTAVNSIDCSGYKYTDMADFAVIGGNQWQTL